MSDFKICAIDAEGDAGSKGLLSGSYCSDQGSGYYKQWEQFRDVLEQHARQGYTFVAHNAEYDGAVIFWQHREHARMVYFNGKFNHAEWFYDYDARPAHIWDSVGLSGGLSLERLGSSIGLPKLPTPQVLTGQEPNRYAWICDTHNKGECIECYSIRDAEIVYHFMCQYVDFLAMFEVPPKRTIGSAAVSIWRKLDATGPIWLRNDTHREMARAAYFGGRVETFKLGTIRPCWTADVQSMYPYIMATTPMPKSSTLQYNDSRHLDDRWLNYEGVTECTIDVPKTYIPVLPVLVDNKLIFPIGRLTGTWVNAELRAAIVRGARIIKVHRVLYSKENFMAFTNYVNELMQIRHNYKHADDPRELQTKIMLNSLYGRIGMQDCQLEEHIEPMPNGADSWHFPDREWKVINGSIFMRLLTSRVSNHRYGNVLWAATITAYARLRLLDFMESCGDSLVYCDTDSIFSNRPIAHEIEGFGNLCDRQEWDYAKIVAPKLYRLTAYNGETKVRAKGIRAGFRDEYLDVGEVRYSQPYRARESVSRGSVAGEWHEITKRKRQTVAKRNILDLDQALSDNSFSDTSPLVFSADENPLSDDPASS